MPLTEKQKKQVEIMHQFPNVLSYGGARSGKTYGTLQEIVYLALTHPESRWLIARKYATDIRSSIWMDTLPKVLNSLNLEQGKDYMSLEAGMIITFKNKSRIICGGLDDKERVDKILGQEYFGIYLNESQDIPYSTVKTLLTRLAQKVVIYIDNKTKAVAQNRLFVDLNPTSINHWTYKMFILKINPESNEAIPFPDSYTAIQMNPHDNQDNLPPGYIERALEVLKGNARNRYLLGEYTTDDDVKVFSPPESGLYDWPEFMQWGELNWADVQIVGGLDLGFQDADALCFIAWRNGDPIQWIVYEHKLRRQNIDQLAEATRKGLKWCTDNIPCRSQKIDIYGDTATVRHGHEGNSKKSISQLALDYNLPIRPAYKRDKMMAIEHLQGEINSGTLKIPRNGVFFEETEITVWTREEDGSILRIIDDKIFHPDMMDAVLYPMRFLVSYGNSAMIPYEPVPEGPQGGTPDQVQKMQDALMANQEGW
jgi:PBSX family phage terminase large subunit